MKVDVERKALWKKINSVLNIVNDLTEKNAK